MGSGVDLNYKMLIACVLTDESPEHLIRKVFGVDKDNMKKREDKLDKYPWKKDKAWELYNKGYNDREIAEEIDEKTHTVSFWRKKNKLSSQTKKRKYSQDYEF